MTRKKNNDLDEIKETLSESTDLLKSSCTNLQNDIVDYAKSRPLKALGLALVTGFVIAKLLA